MEKNSKWYLALICLIGVVIGIVFVGVLTSVVHWAGSPKFCGEFCHSMDLTYVAYQKGDHFRTGSGAKMIDRNFSACRGCHDVEKMYDPKRPMLAEIHRGFGPESEKKVDCLACHPTAGHNYGYIIPRKTAKTE